MTPRTEFPEVVEFRPGQRLRAEDLTAALTAEARHRALHVRVLHDTWGVAEGLEVETMLARSVRVRPGIAYDLLGRELVLREGVVFPVPGADVLGGWTLVIRADDAEPVRPGAGCPDGAGRRASGRLAWRDPKRVRTGEEVPLARVLMWHGFPLVAASAGSRAQPARRPHVGWGLVTDPPKPWTAWPSDAAPAGFQARIETSVAGFTGAVYFVQPVGGAAKTNPPANAVGPFVSVENPSAEGFDLTVVWPVADAAAWPAATLLSVLKGWQWFWVGVEVGAAGGG